MTFGSFGGGGTNRVKVFIVGDKSDLDRKVKASEKVVKTSGSRMTRGLKANAADIKRGFTVAAAAMVAVGVAAVKLASKFDSSMTKIVSLVGIAADEVDAMGESVKDLAGETAKGPAELADALFKVTSAGLRGKQALQALEFAAKASAVGLGTTAAVADALTSAMNAYAKSGLTAEEATNILVATVREGKLEASELGAAIGQVLPIASEMGVTFDEVGAAIAAMTRLGLNSAESVTALKALLTTIIKPAQAAAGALSDVGLSSEGLRRQLREDGLLAVLHTLREAFEGNQDALTKVIPNVRALTGFMALTGDAAEATNTIFGNLEDTTGEINKAFGIAADTIKFRLNKVMVDGQILLLKFLPTVESVLRGLMALTGELSELEVLGERAGLDVGSIELADVAIRKLSSDLSFLGIGGLVHPDFKTGIREILIESDLTTNKLIRLRDHVEFLENTMSITGHEAKFLRGVINEMIPKRVAQDVIDLREQLEELGDTQMQRDAILGGLDQSQREVTESTEDATEATMHITEATRRAIQADIDYKSSLRDLVGQSDRTFSEMAGDVESFLTGFAKLPKKVHIHLAEFEANFRARAESMKSFWTNLGTLADQGLDALVDELITGGPETAMIAEEYVNDPIRAGIMNAFIEGTEQGLLQAQSRIEGFDMPDAHFTLVPDFEGIPPPPGSGDIPGAEEGNRLFDINITGFVGSETELAAEIDQMLTRRRSEVVG